MTNNPLKYTMLAVIFSKIKQSQTHLKLVVKKWQKQEMETIQLEKMKMTT
jgi:hypothetical protein